LNKVKTYWCRGFCYAQRGKFDRAAEDYAVALESGGTQPALLAEAALIYFHLGNDAACRSTCGQLEESFQRDPENTVYSMASTFAFVPVNAGIEDRLLAETENAASRNSRSCTYLHLLGAVQCRTGHFEQAIQTLENAVRLHHGHGSPQDWLFLSMACLRTGDTQEAYRWLRRFEEWSAVEKKPSAQRSTVEPRKHPLSKLDFLRYDLLYREIRESVDEEGDDERNVRDPSAHQP